LVESDISTRFGEVKEMQEKQRETQNWQLAAKRIFNIGVVASSLDNLGKRGTVAKSPVVHRFAYRIVNRLVDITGASLGLLILSAFF